MSADSENNNKKVEAHTNLHILTLLVHGALMDCFICKITISHLLEIFFSYCFEMHTERFCILFYFFFNLLWVSIRFKVEIRLLRKIIFFLNDQRNVYFCPVFCV